SHFCYGDDCRLRHLPVFLIKAGDD
ncbi:permease, partial [Escherichia coli]